MLLIDYARDTVGLPMGGVLHGRHYGWTTDRAKADAMRDAGAYVMDTPSLDKRAETRKFDGFEVSFSIDSVVRKAVAA